MSEPRSRRVVVTGVGLVSPFGNDKAKFWTALKSGTSGVRSIESIPTEALPISCGAEATEFTGHISEFGALEAAQKKAIRKGLKVMCREIQMGVAAAQLAFQDASLGFDDIDRERTGVVYGSDYIMTMPTEFEEGIRGCLTGPTFQFDDWAEHGLTKVTPLWLLKYLPNMPACHVAIYNDLRGPNNSITVKEASSNLALAEAYCTIQRGHADAMVSGATGTRIHPIKTIHTALQEELASENGDPSKACRPFDANRTGMVVGEGAAAFVLEELEHAQARDATILAEVVGFGSSAVIDPNSLARRDIAIRNAMQQAVQSAGLRPEDVGHINAHGIASVLGDREEAAAIQSVFGDRANRIPVVAPKSFFGNIGAGGGALELIASVQALGEGVLFPTLNYEQPDPECDIEVVTSCVPAGNSALNVNVTPHGQASALLVQVFSG